MDFIGYHSDALGAAVELVNAVESGDGTSGRLRELVGRHGYRVRRASSSTEEALRVWVRRLRTVFEASDPAAAAAAVNALLADVAIQPHLTDHDGGPWHLHYTPPRAPVLERVRATTVFALAVLVAQYGTDRHGRCAAPGCPRVYADTSRNGGRRYCSAACANRTAVAAHRARARAAGGPRVGA